MFGPVAVELARRTGFGRSSAFGRGRLAAARLCFLYLLARFRAPSHRLPLGRPMHGIGSDRRSGRGRARPVQCFFLISPEELTVACRFRANSTAPYTAMSGAVFTYSLTPNRRPGCLQDRGAKRLDRSVELRGRHDVADDAEAQSALRCDLGLRIDQIAHGLARQAIDEGRHHHGWQNVVRHLRHLEDSLIAGERDITGRGDRAAETSARPCTTAIIGTLALRIAP